MYESFAEKEIAIIKNIMREGKSGGEFISNVPKDYAELLMHLLHGAETRSIKSITGNGMDPKIYRELRSEMMLTIDIFIKVIQK